MRKLQIAIFAAALVMAVQARAAYYNITYTDGGANVGAGQINVVGGVAIGGSFNVTAGTALGSWTLSPGAGSNGSFIWDNAVNVLSDPFLTGGGLLFTQGTVELNIWGNSPGNYSLYGNIGGNFNPVSIGGLATLTAAVPEPTTMVAGAGALGLALLGIGRARRSSVVRIGK